MKVGLLTTGFPRFDGDHSGAFLLTLARRMASAGHEIIVLAPEPAERRTPPTWPGIQVVWVPYARPRFLQQAFYGSGAPDNLRAAPWRWAGAASFTLALVHRARRELVDCDALVSSWCVPSGWAASYVAAERPHLCLCHATELRWLRAVPGGGAIARQVSRGATSMWFLSKGHRDDFFETAAIHRGSMPAHVGPMPTDPVETPAAGRNELRAALALEGPSLLFLGRLVPIKGVDLLIRAVAGLEPKVHVRIAGDGPERDSLAALAAELDVDATFEGWVSGRRKEALLHACDALVVPSRPGDGLPTVLAEARARELPIIATRVGAVAEYLGDDPSIRLVIPEDPAALHHAIGELMD